MATLGFNSLNRLITRKSYAAIQAQMSHNSLRTASDAGKLKVSNPAENSSIEIETLQQTNLTFKDGDIPTKNHPRSADIDHDINEEVLTNFYLENDGRVPARVDVDGPNTGLVSRETMSKRSDHTANSAGASGSKSKILNQLDQQTKAATVDQRQGETSDKILDLKVRDLGEAMVVKCVKASKKISDGNLLKKLTDTGSEIKKKLPDWQRRVASSLTSFQDYVTKKMDKKKEK